MPLMHILVIGPLLSAEICTIAPFLTILTLTLPHIMAAGHKLIFSQHIFTVINNDAGSHTAWAQLITKIILFVSKTPLLPSCADETCH
jgi:hypothetical protein